MRAVSLELKVLGRNKHPHLTVPFLKVTTNSIIYILFYLLRFYIYGFTQGTNIHISVLIFAERILALQQII